MMKIRYLLLFLLAVGFFPFASSASVLRAVSANETVEEGQSFEVLWFLDTTGQSINTIDLKLKFNPDVLEAIEAGPGESLVNLWIKPPIFDNSQGNLELTGGMANGVSGSEVPLFRSVFRAKSIGRAEITMDAESQNLRNDGSGTPEPLTFTALSFPVVPKGSLPLSVISETHPDQDSWYRSGDVKLRFSAKPGESYSYSISQNPDIYPDNNPMEIPETVEYEGLPDGVYYFKANVKLSDNAWKEAGFYRIQIDATEPESFLPVLGSDPGIAEGSGFLSFSTLDKTSGISHYEARMGWSGGWKQTTSPLKLNRWFAGDIVLLRAYDAAGNYREASFEYRGYVNSKNAWGYLLGLLSAMVVYWTIKKRANKKAR